MKLLVIQLTPREAYKKFIDIGYFCTIDAEVFSEYNLEEYIEEHVKDFI